MMNIQPLTLMGQHICLEPLNEAHIPELIESGSDPSIWQFSWPKNQHHPDVMANYLNEMIAQQAAGKRLHFAVRHLSCNRMIGATSYCNFQEAHLGLEIGGTWFAIEFQRTFVNTECKYLMLKQAFELWGCVRVQFRADKDNTRSVNAIERIGAVEEGVLRNNYIVNGLCYDINIYSIIDQEWPQVKIRLEGLLMRNDKESI